MNINELLLKPIWQLYPATAIGINLPNSNWIRSVHGSKSVTIGNFTDAYNKAAHGNGFSDEFVYSEVEKGYLEKYGDLTGDLHTDLHECLGHGSGQLLPGVDPDALKAYGSTIEEARADLFGLYYLPDAKMRELGLTPHDDASPADPRECRPGSCRWQARGTGRKWRVSNFHRMLSS